ncbi:MAG: hypothetical protein QG622_2936 [Actinomycetota bacterium]|nr:hypothetical protein [Actinomycetota bacterium]
MGIRLNAPCLMLGYLLLAQPLSGHGPAQYLTGTTVPVAAVVATGATAADAPEDILVFADKDLSVEIRGDLAEAINTCVNDAADGTVTTQRNACAQAASAGNTVAEGSISVLESEDISVVVSGGVAVAIDACVNDAADGTVTTQRNACDQTATAGNTVIVEKIAISSSKNVSIDIDGGVATAGSECTNDASGGTVRDQQNSCVQTATAGNLVTVRSIDILASDNVTIRIRGGMATAIYQCLNDAGGGTVGNQRNTCRQTSTAGNAVEVTSIYVMGSTNITITVDGLAVTEMNECVDDTASRLRAGGATEGRAMCHLTASARGQDRPSESGHPQAAV